MFRELEKIKIDHGIAKQCMIANEDAYTLIKCTYTAKEKYANGGWINIYPCTILQNDITDAKLKLQYAFNIPVAPKKYYFKKAGDTLHFILYFPFIPKDWKQFSLIEYTMENVGFTVEGFTRKDSGIYYTELY